MNKHHEGLYSKICDINLEKLRDSALQINEMIAVHYKSDPTWDFAAKCAEASKVFEQYNLFMYPLPEFHKLFEYIKTFFYECQIQEFGKPLNLNYYLQSWVNVYNFGEFIDWHQHGRTATYAWHGFFCVDTEPSKTSYHYFNELNPFDIESKDGLLVLGKSNTDYHRTYPWTNPDKPRITIAFDIVPSSTIMRLNGSNDGKTRLADMINDYPYFKNHWIPI